MTTGPSNPHALPPAPDAERVAGMHRSLLALAAYALEKAEQADRQARAKLSFLLPLTWFLAGRSVVRDRRFRAMAAMLHALAAIFAPASIEDAPDGDTDQEDVTGQDDLFPASDPWAAITPRLSLATRLAGHPTHPPSSPFQVPRRPAHPVPRTRRPRPPQPRLLPPQQASPRHTPRPQAA